MGTVPTNIHMEIETQTQYTVPIHSQFWRPGDVGMLPKNIHTEIETHYTATTYSHFRDLRDSNWRCIHTDIHVYIHLHIGKILLWRQGCVYIRKH